MADKAVILLSGGIDSTTLLHFLKALGFKLYGISFNYGQRHRKELDYATYWGKLLCKEHKLIYLPINELLTSSALIDTEKIIPEGEYSFENQKITVVPNRNMIMLSLALAYAENIKADLVFYGAHTSDHAVYPDCRPEFIEAISKAGLLATYQKVKVLAPFTHFTKTQIVRLGKCLGVDYNKTWSCYYGQELPCGRCATCKEREKAFKESEVSDCEL